MPAGLAFREGKAGDNFGDLSPFLLHTIRRTNEANNIYDFKMDQEMKNLRDQLYGVNQVDDPSTIYKKNNLYINNKVIDVETEPTEYGSI